MGFSKFFSNLQESPWYRQFLNPVLDEIENDSKLLDIGTGSGKMLEILFTEKNVKGAGTDTNEGMLEEAKVKLRNTNADLHLIPAGEGLSFEKNSFDYVTICNVLFHMKEKEIDDMLVDSLQVLKDDGKIIILTPTGNGNLIKLSRHFFSFKNKGIYVWYRATKKRAKLWSKSRYLKQFASKNKLKYESRIVMHGFALLEIINKQTIN
jgi:ubiquinone/menaquinone biosynthesis C-methylase UbiE